MNSIITQGYDEFTGTTPTPPVPIAAGRLLLESGGVMLLESGGAMLLESAPVVAAAGRLLLESGGAMLLESGGAMLLESRGRLRVPPVYSARRDRS